MKRDNFRSPTEVAGAGCQRPSAVADQPSIVDTLIVDTLIS
jgi:hypothetical protein